MNGLKQAPRAWFEKLKEALLSWGSQNSVSDSSLFYSRKNENLLLLLVYVDDILITGDCQVDIQQLIKDLHHQFDLKTLGLVSYFMGFEVLRTLAGLHLNKSKYASDLLQKTNLSMSSLVLLLCV